MEEKEKEEKKKKVVKPAAAGGRKFGNEDLSAAVKEWCADSGKAEAKYGHISGWDTSEVTSMNSLFRADGDSRGPGEAAKQFNDDISRWNVERVENMNIMFYDAQAFNQDIGKWNTNNVGYMNTMFYDALAFNQDINKWNISLVKATGNNYGSFGHGSKLCGPFNKSYAPKGMDPWTACHL